ncbi:RICIN domain-containing protein [Streptomyces sp. NPDC059165]|uniref:RICIN domain-containing protein n=1 Tax=Streptomyces sp. NPDC059165 TaxID=3346751 RepID=UPI0036B1B928
MTPTASDDDPLLLRAFRTLQPSWRAALCPELAETPAPTDGPEPRPDADRSSEALARLHLCETYVRTYTAEAPSRACRHLGAVMDDTVRSGTSRRSDELDRHVRSCPSCARVMAELTTLHGGTLAEVAALLQQAAAQAGDGRANLPAAPVDATASGPSSGPGRRRLRGLVAASPVGAAALTGVVVTALAATVLVVSATGPVKDTGTPPPRSVATPPSLALPDDPAPTSAPATTSAPPRESTAPRRTARPSATTQPATAVVSTPSRPPTGFRLVNKSTGLCIGPVGADDGAMLRLEDCSASAWQRWEAVDAGYGSHRLRNTGTHKCLDGTGNGGNVVRVVQNDCRADASPERDTQLWTFVPERGTAAFRLKLVPRVPASDYSDHLLGPEDWWEQNPPRKGSHLAQLPNYYNSESFVFVKDTGA